jgi:hypothetical protein
VMGLSGVRTRTRPQAFRREWGGLRWRQRAANWREQCERPIATGAGAQWRN